MIGDTPISFKQEPSLIKSLITLRRNLMYLYLWLKNWLAEQEGQDLIEYSLIIALIVLVAIVGMTAVGGQIAAIWTQITTGLTTAAS